MIFKDREKEIGRSVYRSSDVEGYCLASLFSDDNLEYTQYVYLYCKNPEYGTWLLDSSKGPFDNNIFSPNFISLSEKYCLLGDSNNEKIRIVDMTDNESGSYINEISKNDVGLGEGSSFGSSLSFNYELAVSTAPNNNSDRGVAFVFEKDIDIDNWDNEDLRYTLSPSSHQQENGDLFGSSSDCYKDIVVIGARGETDGKGAVYIFTKENNWNEKQRISPSDLNDGDHFGASVSIYDEYLFIGAPDSDISEDKKNVGAVYVYKYSSLDDKWIEVKKIRPSYDVSDYSNDKFGSSVSIYGNYMVASAPFASSEKGIISFYYQYNNWSLIGYHSGGANDRLGENVSIDSSVSIVSSKDQEDDIYYVNVYEYVYPSIKQGQEFKVDGEFVPSKVSLYLKRVGENIDNYWVLDSINKTVIDSTNFSNIDKSYNSIIINNDLEFYTGNGYMITSPFEDSIFDDSTDLNHSVLEYPIRAISDGNYYLWLRVLSKEESDIDIDVLIDGHVVRSINQSIDIDVWKWISTNIIIPDKRPHIIGFKIKNKNVAIDKFYLDKNISNPRCEGPIYSISPYLTTHLRIYDSIDSGGFHKPHSLLPIYDWKTTLENIKIDDWYNFDISILEDNENFNPSITYFSSDSYFIVLSSTGSNRNNFLLWESFPKDGNLISALKV